MKKTLEILGVIGAVILGILAFLFGPKYNSSNVAVENKKALDEVKSNDASLVQESAKREEIKEDAKKEENVTPTTDNVVDFFNNRK